MAMVIPIKAEKFTKGGEIYMTDIHQKKEVKTTNVVNPIIAGIAGAVAGGVAVAAAIVMSDKKNQKKVAGALVDAKEKITQKIEEVVLNVKEKTDTKK
jgi:hypothetical protein